MENFRQQWKKEVSTNNNETQPNDTLTNEKGAANEAPTLNISKQNKTIDVEEKVCLYITKPTKFTDIC